MKPIYGIFGIVFANLSLTAWADTCPPPPSSIDPSVTANVSFDKKSGVYIYKYDVQNGRSSQIPISDFILQISQEPTSVQSPEHWLPDFMNLGHMPTHFLWGSVPSSRYKSVDIAPGNHLSGFSFRSSQPPGLVQYNAEGRTGVPSSSPPPEGSLDDEPMPNCPDWDFESPRFKALVTGVTTGPLPPNTVSVSMRLREEAGTRPAAPINPATPTGKVSVLIPATKSFDPSQIVVSSVKLGPDEAAPIASKLVPARNDDDRDIDREEWEKLSRGLGDDHDHDRDKDPKKQNLLLTFDLASLGVQCVLDKAVVLTGKTQAGVNIIGGASTRLVGCDVRHPGKHRRKPNPKELASELKKQHRLQRAKGNQ